MLLTPPSYTQRPKINWMKSIKSEGIQAYAQEVSSVVSPLLSKATIAMSELDSEVTYVCKAIHMAAQNHLVVFPKTKKAKAHFNDAELKRLCKNSKVTWEAWCAAGRPMEGQVYTDKQAAKKLVRKHFTSLRAKR